MMSSLGFHTMTLLLSPKASEAISLITDFFQYSHDTSRIKIDRVYKENGQKKAESIKKNNDGTFYLPLETIVTYRHDIGIRWRIICKRSSPAFNSYTIEVKINPKILSGINDYLTSATIDDMEAAISNFNQEAKRISPLLQDFSCYKLSRVDYCVNFSLKELAPDCTPERMINLIKRSNIPPSYREWVQYDEIAHRYKSRAGSFYLMNGSVHINCYSKFMQLKEQSEENIKKGLSPIPSAVLDKAWDIIRFEIQCKYRRAYSLSQIASDAGNHQINKYETLLDHAQCVDQISEYYKKTIGKGDWYSLQEAIIKIENQDFNSQKKRRLIDALRLVNQCRSVAKAITAHQGREQESFKQTLKELSCMGINPVTIPKEWGIKHISNLLFAYFDKVNDENFTKEMESFQQSMGYEYLKDFGYLK